METVEVEVYIHHFNLINKNIGYWLISFSEKINYLTYDILPDLVGVACLTGVAWDVPADTSTAWEGAVYLIYKKESQMGIWKGIK